MNPQLNPLLQLRDVSVCFNGNGRSTEALDRVSLNLAAGEVISIIGPSGCGKSTLLSVMSGLRRPTQGEVFYRGAKVTGPSRSRVVIFQNHALFPWLTARANVEFSLHARGLTRRLTRQARQEKIDFYLGLVGLSEFQDFYPSQLSGGQQQRVGIARALAAEPELLLLDEPFASLDVIRREELLQEVLGLVKKMKMATVFVTHDIEEALFIGDRIFLMSSRPGRVIREIEIRHEKPGKIIEMKQQREFWSLEKEIHEHLDEFSR